MSVTSTINGLFEKITGLRIVRAKTLAARLAANVRPDEQNYFWDLGDSLGIVRLRNGSLVFIDVRDQSLGAPLRAFREWEPNIETLIPQFLPNGGTAIEIGANVGCHVITMARAAGSPGRVIAVEANPVVAQMLRATIEINGLANTTVVQTAILDCAKEVELWASPFHLGGGAVGVPGWEQDPNLNDWIRHKVHAITLDDLAADVANVDLIHIDAEGCELAILAGADKLLARSPAVKIIAEWGLINAPFYFDVEKGLDLLIARGFRFWRISREAALIPQSRDEMLAGHFCDVVMSREDLTQVTENTKA
jgi:FkbM family methyltransferase